MMMICLNGHLLLAWSLCVQRALRLVLEQKYLELLESGPAHAAAALQCLRVELAPHMKTDEDNAALRCSVC